MAEKAPEPKRGPWTVSIRASLIAAMVSLVVLISLGTMAGTIITARGRVLGISRSLVANATDHVAAEMKAFFRPVPGALVIVERFARQEGFDPADTVSLNRLFMPLVASLPQVSSANTGDEAGNSYTLVAEGGGWLTRETRPGKWGAKIKLRRWADEATVVEEWWEDREYDVRQQSWYLRVAAEEHAHGPAGDAAAPPKQAAQKPGADAQTAMSLGIRDRRAMCWTEPYLIDDTNVAAITGARPIVGAGGRKFVAAFDLLLTDLTQFTQRLEPSENGLVWVMTPEAKMIGLPRNLKRKQQLVATRDILRGAEELELQTIGDGIRIWRAHKTRGDDMTLPQRGFSGKKPWWVAVSQFSVSSDCSMLIAVMLPEADFSSQSDQRRLIVWIALGAMVLALVLSAYLSGRYSRPLKSLVTQSEMIQRLELAEKVPVATNLREVRQLTDSHDNMRLALGSFAHYVPTQLVRELLDRGEAATMGVTERRLTVLFSDIQGFTNIAEKLEPRQLTEQIAEYFETGLDALQAGGATIDKLLGDGVIAFWGAPTPDEQHARHAVTAVLKCLKQLDAVNERWHEDGKPRFETRIGLASGPVLVGNIGTYSRFDYTVIGDTVNLASRLEGINKLYGTQALVAESTVRQAGDGFAWRLVDKVSVKGKQQPVRIYELLGYKGMVDGSQLAFAAQYEKALDLFWERRFDDAAGVLSGLDRRLAGGKSVVRLAKLCRQFKQGPPPKDWDGSTEAVL